MLTFSVCYAEQPVLLPFRKVSMSMIHAIAVLCHREQIMEILHSSVSVCVCVCVGDGISKTRIGSTENFKLRLL